MVDTVVHLAVQGGDDFYFTYAEVPQKIPFGGKQALTVHKLVGGRRSVDAMGPDDKPLQWSGMLLGQSALPRARYLDWLRKSGKQCVLTWSELAYLVVVESFDADFERFYKMPYTISCLVVQDLSQPIMATPSPSLDDVMRDDITKALAAGQKIGDGPLTGLLTTLDTAIKAVSSFASASTAAINSVTGPVLAVQGRVNTLIGSVGSTAGNIGTLGGLLPGSNVTLQAAKITNSAIAANQLSQLLNLQSVTGRMWRNLGMGK
ncbi:hypothetical protein [Sideroxydans lithotrophicus]|uniref:Uncharacterized protein n=1 Tax=Sideroxydans lithotrophicus (strain ES-1) TaxID=580332 RepID=D5CT45_SIDLE|nr:hypothetical protein [Sideroxydans lithotrophicus]ADE12131.1 conserved hypothetical protein [Sideroxydans lithotrophicus ES-1]